MPIAAWQCAHGDAPPVTLPCAPTVALAPSDDSVDSNRVIITGNGTITSFGPAPMAQVDIDPDTGEPVLAPCGVTKKVTFMPSGGSIVLQNGASLALLGNANRTVNNKSIGVYACDDLGNWAEESFKDTTVA